MNSIAQQQKNDTTTPPDDDDGFHDIDTLATNVRGLLEHAGEHVGLVLADALDVDLGGDVDVAKQAADANNAIHCAVRELATLVRHVRAGRINGLVTLEAASRTIAQYRAEDASNRTTAVVHEVHAARERITAALSALATGVAMYEQGSDQDVAAFMRKATAHLGHALANIDDATAHATEGAS